MLPPIDASFFTSLYRPKAETAAIHGELSLVSRVRICANKVVAGVRVSALQFRIRSQDTRQFATA